MVTIASLTKNIKAKVDLAVGKNYHRLMDTEFSKAQCCCYLISLILTAAVDFITDGNGTDIIFAIQYIIQQRIQFF